MKSTLEQILPGTKIDEAAANKLLPVLVQLSDKLDKLIEEKVCSIPPFS